jgi:hypothetical protein
MHLRIYLQVEGLWVMDKSRGRWRAEAPLVSLGYRISKKWFSFFTGKKSIPIE